ncbi:MAG: alcohol dehydrogenase, partial [Firmicutes bacterium HGW-Firmicutes-5]
MGTKWDTTPKNDRFEPIGGKKTMKAVVTAGNGGYEKLECREVRMPSLESGEVL